MAGRKLGRARLRILACIALVFLSSFTVALVPLLFSLAIDAYAGKANAWAVGAMGIIAAYAVASWVGRIMSGAADTRPTVRSSTGWCGG
jgi:hypothetical protein